jgi:hypothetical protein
LTETETTEAVCRPIQDSKCPFTVAPDSIKDLWKVTRGYPYFVQYVCREVFDIWVQAHHEGKKPTFIPMSIIMRKLDSDFFSGRWARATDRQRELLQIIASLPNCEREFSVQEIIESKANASLKKRFSGSHVNQMLVSLADAGLAYKNRHGRYAFAVPLLGDFIRRQSETL